MTSDPNLHEESYAAFLTEAQDILQRIEQDLLSLRDDRSPARVHQLMRSAHTLKGAAASVELDTIKQIAHVLEDIFTALYNPDLTVDAEVESLLFQAYECLRLPLMAELMGRHSEEQEFLDRAVRIIARLQEKLGDCFDREAPLPNSVDLGFDVVQSLFDMGVQQRLQELAQAIASDDPAAVEQVLRIKSEIFLGLAESLNLPGFGAIAQTTLAALEAHPDQIMTIALLALEDLRRGRRQVLEGDRLWGGTPSPVLQVLAGMATASCPQAPPASVEPAIAVASLETSTTNTVATETVATETRATHVSPADLSLDEIFGSMDGLWEAPPPQGGNPPATSPERSVFQVPAAAGFHRAEPNPMAVATAVNATAVNATAVNATAVNATAVNTTAMEATTISVSAIDPPAIEAAESQRGEPIRVDGAQLKHLDYLAGELLINQSKQTTQEHQLRAMVQAFRSTLQQHQHTLYRLQDSVERLMGQVEHGMHQSSPTLALVSHDSQSTLSSQFDVLEMERYTDLRVLVRSALNETVRLDQTVEEVDLVTKQSRRSLESQRRILSQVRDDLTALRMRPLRDLLNRFPRLLQQLAEAHHKPVELVLSGAHVLVDKGVVEKLYDPLLHLLRNAFDHGIEPSHVRQAQGKPAIGTIEIRANQQGNQTMIEVRDDGQGINLPQVAQRAIELNLITRDQASTMPESQLLDVLFQPGFSTATEVTDLSGRGIGLDVVNSQLQAMNGSVAVSTLPSQGTTFSLKIPLSLTTTRLLVCHAQGFAYALPVERVEQIVMPAPEHLRRSTGEQRVLHWQQGQADCLVPLYVLSELVRYSDLGTHLLAQAHGRVVAPFHPGSSPLDTTRSAPVLLLQTIYGRRALMVDQVLGEQELVIRSLGSAIASPPYVYGCCILGGGNASLAIDIDVLMQLTTEVEILSNPLSRSESSFVAELGQSPVHLHPSSGRPTSHRLAGRSSPFPRTRCKTVLVVDDSLTLRQHLTTVFEQSGYDVLQANDGLEALAQLRQHPRIQAITCDIEMPNLDGFGFLGHLQRDPRLAKTPVVMLTSRSSAKHRQLALELGAAAYFTKPYDHNDLIATIDRFIAQRG